MAEYKYFKNFQEMCAYVRGDVKVLEPIEVKEVEPAPKAEAEPKAEKPAEDAPKKRGRKKKGESDGNIQAD